MQKRRPAISLKELENRVEPRAARLVPNISKYWYVQDEFFIFLKEVMNEKRIISILIPYKKVENGVVVFLQKRAKDAKRLPDWFGFFGGGKENNETSEETLKREIKEELFFDVNGYKFLGHYEFFGSIKDIYFLEVDDTFESKIKIGEGEYGKFFSKEEVENEEKLIYEDKVVLVDFFRFINN